jgi:hypothetical protein
MQYREFMDLTRSGIVTEGRMIAHRISTDDEGDDSYYITYEFNAGDNLRYEREQGVDYSRYNSYEYRALVNILYLPSNPNVSRIDGTNRPPYEMAGFGVCWSLFFIAMLYGAATQHDRESTLRSKGQVVPGFVVSAKAHEDSDSDYNLTIKYRYNSPQTGDMVMKKQSFIHNEAKKRPLPMEGQQIAVLYYRDNHQRLL